MKSAKEKGHRHGEAYMLMMYACGCGHRETIWNARDGVTPFCTVCPSCGQMTLQHVDWQRDVYARDYEPHPGQRFWRDGTPDEAAAIMRRRLERMQDSHPLPPEEAEKLIAQCRDGTASEFREGWPMLERVPDR